jgi:hypothetical protein
MKTTRVLAALVCALSTLAITGNARVPNLSGQYAGSVNDGTLGNGSAMANLVTSDQNGFGGWMSFTFGNATYDNPVAISTGRNGLRGVFEATINSTACRISFLLTYDRAKHTLLGSYQSVSDGCDDSGSFKLKQQCFYTVQGDVRPAGGPMHC